MTTLETTGLVIGVALLTVAILVPLVASFAICVPKWWKSKVRPPLRSARQAVAERTPSMPTLPSWIKTPITWLFKGLFWLVSLPFVGLFSAAGWYGDRVGIFIKRKCPYTSWCCEHGESYGSYCYACDGLVMDGHVNTDRDPPRRLGRPLQ